MKLLRNPVVVSVLAVVAVVLVFFQIFKPQWERSRARRAAASPPAVAGSPPTETGATSPKPPPPSASPPGTAPAARLNPVAALATVIAPPPKGQPAGSPIDEATITNRLTVWTEAPSRDPFRLFVPEAQDAAKQEAPSPVRQWKLRAIWRQTGERVAAINNGVYKEGDMIEGYRVERIEGDTVWLEGTNRMEHLTFMMTAATNIVRRPQVTPGRPQ